MVGSQNKTPASNGKGGPKAPLYDSFEDQFEYLVDPAPYIDELVRRRDDFPEMTVLIWCYDYLRSSFVDGNDDFFGGFLNPSLD
jgi:hypothetical protein